MIRSLNDEEKIELSKLRIDHPYKLLREWLFGFGNIFEDFEYLYNMGDDKNWRTIGIKVFFCIPIYFLVALWKIVEFCLSPFELDIENWFEFIGGLLILGIFGILRLPYAIYTYMRFNRATALINILKSD